MRKSTILIISILAMLLLVGNLVAFDITIHTFTNHNGTAYIEIKERYSQIVFRRIPIGNGTFQIVTGSNNTQVQENLPTNTYIATIFAESTSGLNHDIQSIMFNSTTETITFYPDINDLEIPDDPPAGN